MQQPLRSIKYMLQHAAAVTAGISCTYTQQYERHTWYEVNPIMTSCMMHDASSIWKGTMCHQPMNISGKGLLGMLVVKRKKPKVSSNHRMISFSVLTFSLGTTVRRGSPTFYATLHQVPPLFMLSKTRPTSLHANILQQTMWYDSMIRNT